MKPFQIVFAYARKYTVALTVTILSMLLLVGVQLLIPWIIRLLIADITAQASEQASLNLITQLTIVVLIVYVVRAGLQFLAELYGSCGRLGRGGGCAQAHL